MVQRAVGSVAWTWLQCAAARVFTKDLRRRPVSSVDRASIDLLFTIKVRSQAVATHGNGFGLFPQFSGPAHLPPVATGCTR
jgi:hypothetical protein